jgi:ABC-2 type transport system permease protein
MLGNLRKNLGLVRLFWSTSISTELEYRLNFLFAFVSSLGTLSGSLFTLFLFYRTGTNLGGWTWQEALLITGCFTLLEGITSTILSANLTRIVWHIQAGTLDFVLLKPVDTQLWLSTRHFNPWGLPDLFFGLVLLGYAGHLNNLSVLDLLRGMPAILAAVVILYSLWFGLCTLSVWFVKIYNVTEVLRAFLESGKYPISAYPVAYRFVFTFILPVAFLTSVPAEALLGRSALWPTLIGFAVAGGLFMFSRWFWRFAMRHYTSASS